MQDYRNLPPELRHLIEKREKERRRAESGKSANQQEAGSKSVMPGTEKRGGSDRRKDASPGS